MRVDTPPKQSIPNIKDLSTFEFEDNLIRCWKAAKIGTGLEFKGKLFELPKVRF